MIFLAFVVLMALSIKDWMMLAEANLIATDWIVSFGIVFICFVQPVFVLIVTKDLLLLLKHCVQFGLKEVWIG